MKKRKTTGKLGIYYSLHDKECCKTGLVAMTD